MKKINKNILETKDKEISLYIHIPFCEKKCSYCDFNSVTANEYLIEKYFLYLEKEILLYKNFLMDKNIISIFIGGGTPSSVDSLFIKRILELLKSLSIFDENIEITIECNPNSLNEEKLTQYLNSSINRFSIGAQSLNENVLKTIGRIHNKTDIINAVELLNSFNVKNFNFDFMLALPYQNMKDIKESLNFIKDYNIPHISYYSLILEEDTPLYAKYLNNSVSFNNDEIDRDMYHFVVNFLNSINLKQYEISNFAKKNHNCIHNLRYWNLKNYLGFGLSSHSNIDNYRFSNENNFNKYFKVIDNLKYPISSIENLSIYDRINEYFILGLRLNKGVDLNVAEDIFKLNFSNYYYEEINKNINDGLINLENSRIFLTELGRDLSNKVELDFIRL